MIISDSVCSWPRCSLSLALCVILSFHILGSHALPLHATQQPCTASSCQQQQPSAISTARSSHPASNSLSSKFAAAASNSTCSKGFAACTMDDGAVDCCDESKVCLCALPLLLSCSPVNCARYYDFFYIMCLIVTAQDWKCFSFQGCRYCDGGWCGVRCCT